ncbi:Uncharacterized deacetylase, LmbE-like [Nitrosopumilaceae archaeon]|nr:PIG-L family deacetylase [Nitrosopumilus sp.]CAI9832575.1 Uncharacterized deacetylase, LmbE-like [Nitrosopumilaceae archaeon]
MRILVVAAHPDDEVIGMGGTLKKLSKKHSIDVLFMADGITARKRPGYGNSVRYDAGGAAEKAMAREIEERKKDAKRALKRLGVSSMKFLGMPDNEMDTVPFLKIVKEVEAEVARTKCDTIFTHHHGDLNIDHRLSYEAAVTAARPMEGSGVNLLASFEVFSATDWRHLHSFRPSMFVDITSEMPYKASALGEYRNEVRKYPHPRSKRALEASAGRWGSLYGYGYAEAFEIVYVRGGRFPLV